MQLKNNNLGDISLDTNAEGNCDLHHGGWMDMAEISSDDVRRPAVLAGHRNHSPVCQHRPHPKGRDASRFVVAR